MAEVILPPEELEPELPEEQLPEVDKPTELSKVITVKFNPLDTGMTSTANTRQSFYTTDTDAWVVFEIENMDAPNGEYSLVLYNKSDGSVFQRTGDIISGAAYYKIEEEEIKHAGDWVGQVVITLVNGKTTTSRFSFNVAGHLLDGKDVRQIVIQDFDTLMKQLEDLKNSADIDINVLKSNIEEAQRLAKESEATRQETFEVNESERIAAEDERKQAELQREETYDSKVDAAIVEADVVTKVDDKVAELSPTIQNVTAQLADKVGAGKKAEPEDLSATTLGMIAGTGGPINLLSIPQDKSVTPLKTTFFTTTKNLFNPYTITTGKYIYSINGLLVTSANHYSSDFIPITTGLKYVANATIGNYAFYDVDRVFLNSVTIQPLGVPFTAPTGAAFVRITLGNGTDRFAFQIEQNESVTTFESPFVVDPKFMKTPPQPPVTKTGWEGYSGALFGDSIQWQDGKAYASGGQIARGMGTIIKEKLGLSLVDNKGVSGAPMANGSANGAGTNTVIKNYTSFSARSLVKIAAGTNDFKLNVPMGTIGAIGDTVFDNTTFYGAYRESLEFILKTNPKVRIVLFTPLQRNNGGYNSWDTVNTAGHKLSDYVEAIKAIGRMYSIHVVDLFTKSGFNKFTLATYTMDGLHPNDEGYHIIGEIGAREILSDVAPPKVA